MNDSSPNKIDHLFGIAYNTNVRVPILKTRKFLSWLETLPAKTQAIVNARFDRIELDGHFGLVNRFDGLIELKWTSGLRIYTFLYQNRVMIVLWGGNKNGQEKDIHKAKKIREALLSGAHSK